MLREKRNPLTSSFVCKEKDVHRKISSLREIKARAFIIIIYIDSRLGNG